MTIDSNFKTNLADAYRDVTSRDSHGGNSITLPEVAYVEAKTGIDWDGDGEVGVATRENRQDGVRNIEAAHAFTLFTPRPLTRQELRAKELTTGLKPRSEADVPQDILADYVRFASSDQSFGQSTITKGEKLAIELFTGADLDGDGEIFSITNPDVAHANIADIQGDKGGARTVFGTGGAVETQSSDGAGEVDEPTDTAVGYVNGLDADDYVNGMEKYANFNERLVDLNQLFRRVQSEEGRKLSASELEYMELILQTDIDDNGSLGDVTDIRAAREFIGAARRLVDVLIDLKNEGLKPDDPEFLKRLAMAAQDDIHHGDPNEITAAEIRAIERITGADLDGDGSMYTISNEGKALTELFKLLELLADPVEEPLTFRDVIAKATMPDSEGGSYITDRELSEALLRITKHWIGSELAEN